MKELLNVISEFGWINAAILAAYLVIGWPVISSAAKNIIHGKIFDENFLMVIASIGSIAIGEYSEALAVVTLYRIGEFLQDKAVDNSRRSITDLIDIRPEYANIQEGRELVQVAPESLKVGDIIIVKPGERIPVDGVVTEGESRLDTAALTGESMPVFVSKNDDVCSGSINLDGLIKIKVSKPVSESTAQRILDLVENSAFNKAKTENFISKFAAVYTPAVCILAVLVAAITAISTHDWHNGIEKAVIMLVVSCPCALVISIPLGFFGGIGGASKKGILFKGGNHIEALSKAGTVIFDKTGTLTKGVFKVIAIHPQEMKERRLLELAAYAESFSNHPIARSLAEEYGKHIDKAQVSDVTEIAGQGICSLVGGIKVQCGNKKYMTSLGIDVPDCHIPGTIVHIVVNNEYAGHIVISDKIKEDSAESLAALKKLGVKRNVMLTGDKQQIADAVVKEIGNIDEYYAECLPEDKVAKTQQYLDECKDRDKAASSKKSTVVFVGDGINDAPVLTIADVGIAMGGMGTAAAVEAADIVLMNDRPSDIVKAVQISRKTMRLVKENIIMALGIKFLVIVLAAFGFTSMWLAEFADIGVCLLAILNSMRALKN